MSVTQFRSTRGHWKFTSCKIVTKVITVSCKMVTNVLSIYLNCFYDCKIATQFSCCFVGEEESEWWIG